LTLFEALTDPSDAVSVFLLRNKTETHQQNKPLFPAISSTALPQYPLFIPA